jgi:hypothetical protein
MVQPTELKEKTILIYIFSRINKDIELQQLKKSST